MRIFVSSRTLTLLPTVDTEISVVEEFFKKLTARDDVAIVLINQSVSTASVSNLRYWPYSFPSC